MKNKTILIAEDEGIIAIDIQNMLMRNGFNNVFLLTDGNDLLKKALADLPGLIITDILLKNETDGIKSVEKIWEISSVPVIFITAKNIDKYKNHYDPLKCEFIKKPFKESELMSSLTRLLSTSIFPQTS